MSLLHDLRAQTREAHDGLEERLDVPSRAADGAAYADLLTTFRSVYAPLERAVAACPATPRALPDWAARVKTPWLDADLRALGRALPADAVVGRLRTAEDVVGTLYVLEGATLGGAVLVGQLDPLLPRRFFSSYGAERGAMWRGFRRRVDALEDGLRSADVVAAARRTFALFEAAAPAEAA